MTEADRPTAGSLLARSLRELVVIVVGVLIALALEGWWSEREERGLEEEYLAALLTEARGNLEAARDAAEVVELNAAALDRGRRLLAAPLEPDSAAVFLQSLLQGSMITPVAAISHAVFEDLRSTGRLRLIEDEEIRLEVVRHYANIAAHRARQEELDAATGARLHALASRHVPPGSLEQRGPRVIIHADSVPAADLLDAARALHAHPDVRAEVRATARGREAGRRLLEVLGQGTEGYVERLEGAE